MGKLFNKDGSFNKRSKSGKSLSQDFALAEFLFNVFVVMPFKLSIFAIKMFFQICYYIYIYPLKFLFLTTPKYIFEKYKNKKISKE